jgi:hypothetical protein
LAGELGVSLGVRAAIGLLALCHFAYVDLEWVLRYQASRYWIQAEAGYKPKSKCLS